MKRNPLTLKYIITISVSVLLTFFFHELAHLLMGQSLGYEMVMDLNSVNLKKGQSYYSNWHRQLVSAAGPIFTIIQAIFFLIIINKTKKILLYPFLFTAALMRFMATIISAITIANDEARISEWLGIGKMTLPIIVTLLLITFCIKTTKSIKLNWKFNLITFLITSVNITALVYLNQYFFK